MPSYARCSVIHHFKAPRDVIDDFMLRGRSHGKSSYEGVPVRHSCVGYSNACHIVRESRGGTFKGSQALVSRRTVGLNTNFNFHLMPPPSRFEAEDV
jgi:hypothetical protein